MSQQAYPTYLAQKLGDFFFSDVLEALPQSIFVKNANPAVLDNDAEALKYVYLNEWFEIVTGLPRQKLIGHSAKNIFPKDYQQYFAAERATERGRVWSRAKLSNQGELGVFGNSQRLIAPSHPKDIPV